MDHLTPKGYHPSSLIKEAAEVSLFVRCFARKLPSRLTVTIESRSKGRGIICHELWEGNEATAEAAIRARCQAYFGYPITPPTELLEYMARRMPDQGRSFVQAEANQAQSTWCTVQLNWNAVTTSSFSPGTSLMMRVCLILREPKCPSSWWT